MVTQEQLAGNWTQMKGRIKQRWGQLSDDELRQAEGNFERLVGLIQEKTGEARSQIEKALDELSAQAGGAFGQAAEAARQYTGQAAESLRTGAEQARERALEGYEQARDLFRRRPAESLAVAFGTGLLVGVIVGLVACSRD